MIAAMTPTQSTGEIAAETDPPHFCAVLTPNRSLGGLGFLLVMALVCGVSFAAGIAFMLKGAWPMMGFFGLDVILIYVAFRLSYRSGRLSETVELTERRLTVCQRQPGGREQVWEFEPYWLQVRIEEPPKPDSPLTLISHGQRLAIARFLSPDERLDFANALRRELGHLRIAPGAEI